MRAPNLWHSYPTDVLGGALIGGGAGALLMSHPRLWPVPHWLDYLLVAVGVALLLPLAIRVIRMPIQSRAYRKGRISEDQYRAFLRERA